MEAWVSGTIFSTPDLTWEGIRMLVPAVVSQSGDFDCETDEQRSPSWWNRCWIGDSNDDVDDGDHLWLVFEDMH